MSGTFNDIDVPPTLCSFAVGTGDVHQVVSTELKKAGNRLMLLDVKEDKYGMPVYDDVMTQYAALRKAIFADLVKSTFVVGFGGIIEAVGTMQWLGDDDFFAGRIGFDRLAGTVSACGKGQDGKEESKFSTHRTISFFTA